MRPARSTERFLALARPRTATRRHRVPPATGRSTRPTTGLAEGTRPADSRWRTPPRPGAATVEPTPIHTTRSRTNFRSENGRLRRTRDSRGGLRRFCPNSNYRPRRGEHVGSEGLSVEGAVQLSSGPGVVRRLRAFALALAFIVFVAVGVLGVARDVIGYALYRGFAPILIPSWIKTRASVERVWIRSSAVGGRIQPVVVVLPPGYARNPLRRYPVLYLLHGYPEFPGAFLSVGQAVALEDIVASRQLMHPPI